MDETLEATYWCHMCSQMVTPVLEDDIKCPLCESGFIEEMGSNTTMNSQDSEPDAGSDRALSLWAPILLDMMGSRRRRHRRRRNAFTQDDNNNHDNDDDGDGDDVEALARRGGDTETELDRELASIIRRRRRSSATILHMLQGLRTGLANESENREEGERGRDGERVILINPFNQTIIVHGQNHNQTPLGSLGDYFVGPGLDLLLQHLAENDPNRYGTPPAKKEAIDAMPTVKIAENVQCSVCLDDFEVGSEAKEMPCKHKFHDNCILPWLELHSSCPVCRFQLPNDESKLDADGSGNGNIINRGNVNNGEDEDGDGGNGNGTRFSIPWPFNGLFSSANARGSGSRTDEN